MSDPKCELVEVHFVPLTINGLNAKTMVPRKDHKEERLIPALLQLTNGTELILDETAMEAGQLTDIGMTLENHNTERSRFILDVTERNIT